MRHKEREKEMDRTGTRNPKLPPGLPFWWQELKHLGNQTTPFQMNWQDIEKEVEQSGLEPHSDR